MSRQPWSFVVHAWNEADALKRLVLSSLPLADLIGEWVILDHRSSDHTQEVIAEIGVRLYNVGVDLKVLHEARDLSAGCTFADVRTRTVKAASNPLVALQDADFILGPGYRALLERAGPAISAPNSLYCGGSYTVPVVWDRLAVDDFGIVRDHGRIWTHSRRPRLLWRDAVHWEQTKDRGRWEQLMISGRRQHTLPLSPSPRGNPVRDAVVSVNVKPAERIALRDGMTMFMQDAVQGRVSGDWLDNVAAGRVRSQGPYDYDRATSVRGWRLNTPALMLDGGALV